MTGKRAGGVHKVNSQEGRFEDVQPVPPTSGEILGIVVRRLGLKDPALSSKNAQRYFEGRSGAMLKDASLDELIAAIARVVIDAGLVPGAKSGSDAPIPLVSQAILFNAREWDSLVTHMRRGSQHVDRSNLPAVWAAFFRLLTIDAAIRIGAAMWVTDTHPENLESLNYIDRSARGSLLKWIKNDVRKEQESGGVNESTKFTLEGLAEATGVDRNTVDNWLNKGARPNDKHLQAIAATIAKVSGSEWEIPILRHLRRFYWASDLAKLIKGIIGDSETKDIVEHLTKYSELSYRALHKIAHAEDSTRQLMDIFFTRGSGLDLSRAVAYGMSEQEENPAWREYLEAIAFDGWAKHIWRVIRRIRRSEIDLLDEPTHAALMRNWSVSNPEAYELYEQSIELRAEGKLDEAIALVEKSLTLDQTDPTYHFTLGSIYGGIGANSADDELFTQRTGCTPLGCATRARMASTVDNDWLCVD